MAMLLLVFQQLVCVFCGILQHRAWDSTPSHDGRERRVKNLAHLWPRGEVWLRARKADQVKDMLRLWLAFPVLFDVSMLGRRLPDRDVAGTNRPKRRLVPVNKVLQPFP